MTARASPGIVKRSLVIAGHATSVSLEEPFWIEVKRIAAERGLSLAALVASVDATRSGGNLSSALRLLVLEDLRAAASGRGPDRGSR